MPIDEKHLLGIGRITANFAALEIEVAFGIWTLISPDQAVGQMVTGKMSFGNQLQLFDSLVRHKVQDQNTVAAIRDWISRAYRIEESRNVITHSVWMVDSSDVVTRIKFTTRLTKGLQFQAEDVSAEQLDQIADEVRDLANELKESLLPRTWEGLPWNPPIVEEEDADDL